MLYKYYNKEQHRFTRYVNMKPEFLYRKNILFEVLPIVSYTFFPPVWQLVDATPEKLSLF